MRSGKPPAPWRRKKARALSGVRIGVLCVVFALAAAFALYRLRPLPLPWHAVGRERIVTPAFDIADEDTRRVMNWLEQGLLPVDGEWLGKTCSTHPVADEVYVLTDSGVAVDFPRTPRRIVVTMQIGGEVVDERWVNGTDASPIRTQRVFDEAGAEEFRRLIADGGYSQLAPAGENGYCHRSTVALESCVRGRYYAVLRYCEIPSHNEPLDSLAAAIEAFAQQSGPAGADPR